MAIKHTNLHYLQPWLTLHNYTNVLTGLGHFWDTYVTMSSLSVVWASLTSEACSQDSLSAGEEARVIELFQSTLFSPRKDPVPTSLIHCLDTSSEYLDFWLHLLRIKPSFSKIPWFGSLPKLRVYFWKKERNGKKEELKEGRQKGGLGWRKWPSQGKAVQSGCVRLHFPRTPSNNTSHPTYSLYSVTLTYFIGHSNFLFVECLSNLSSFSYWVICLFLIDLYKFCIFFWVWALWWLHVLQMSFPLCSLSI